jgi:hypothetical protein
VQVLHTPSWFEKNLSSQYPRGPLKKIIIYIKLVDMWRSSPYSPTLSYPVVLFLSSTARAVVFPDLGVVCFTNRTALTTWISPRTLLTSFGPRNSVLFFLALKTGEDQVGVERVALREDSRIFLGNFLVLYYCHHYYYSFIHLRYVHSTVVFLHPN